MFVYLVLALLVPAGYFVLRKNEKRDLYVVASVMTVFFLLLCVRSTFGFHDLPNYYNSYNAIKEFTFSQVLKGTHFFASHDLENMESGYVWLNWLLSRTGLGFHALLIVHGAFVSASLFYLIRKYSLNPCFTLFFYLCIGGLTDHTYIVRQSFAFAILLFAVGAVTDKKPIRFLLLVILATTFHRTASSFLLIYPLSYIKVNRKTGIVGIVATLALFALIPVLMPLVKFMFELMHRPGYLAAIGEPEFRQTIVLIVAMLAFVLVIKPQDKDLSRSDNVMFWLVIISLFFMVLSVYLPILSRVGMSMYLPFAAILIPNVIEMNENKALMKKISLALAVALFVYLVFICITQEYYFSFIWEAVDRA